MHKEEKEFDYEMLPVEVYDGLSLNIVKKMIEGTFEEGSLITVRNEVDESIKRSVPIYKMVLDYIKLLDEGDIRLTKTGNLPPKHVKKLYEENEIKEPEIEMGGYKLKTETDSNGVVLTRALCKLMKYTKIRKGVLSLTALGKEIIGSEKNEERIFRDVITSFTKTYKFSLLDGHKEELPISDSISYTYYLMDKYGEDSVEMEFYLDKFIEAFPAYLEMLGEGEEVEDRFKDIYSVRVFNRYFKYLGFIKGSRYEDDSKIVKTELFNEVIDMNRLYELYETNEEAIKKAGLEGNVISEV